ncbi:MAG: hypothetical protein LH472_07725 [Pyrinomonadaceae bacterium]|nr:hypothetical protein [Pyrinomonadaceae bacterium]
MPKQSRFEKNDVKSFGRRNYFKTAFFIILKTNRPPEFPRRQTPVAEFTGRKVRLKFRRSNSDIFGW